MEDKHTALTPFNNPDVQHLVHETNRLTGTAIRYIDSVKLEPFKVNDSRIFIAIEYIKSIRTAVDKYYTAIKDNFDQNASLTSELKELKEQNRILKELNGGKLLAYDQMKENLEMYAVRLSERDEEITRLKEENSILIERLEQIKAISDNCSQQKDYVTIWTIADSALSKHQPIKKDENTIV